MARPSKPIEPAVYGPTATPIPRTLVPRFWPLTAFLASHPKSSAPLSSASRTLAPVT
jgi:hypothetical protein